MKSPFDLILPSLPIYKVVKDGVLTDIVTLDAVNDINIFIGSNNSGKSLFMRKLMASHTYTYVNRLQFNLANELINTFRFSSPYSGQDLELFEVNKDLPRVITSRENRRPFNNNPDIINGILHNEEPKVIFIPVLRSAHSLYDEVSQRDAPRTLGSEGYKFNKIEDDIFLNTIRHNYEELQSDNIEIFTGLDLYKEILNSRNSDRNTRMKFQTFEDFVGENFFNGQKVDIVANFNKRESLSGKNTNEQITLSFEKEKGTYKLHDLGDGIQALIILLFKVFMAEDGTYIFIDEPEINLHPGMQRVFLEQITSNEFLKKKKLKYFISTHSNHLIDLTLDLSNVSIYSFSPTITEDREKNIIIKNVNAGDNSVLKNIGVNNSAVFMANCSIWVEGISDRNYIKAFLQSYCKFHRKPYPREDIDYAFFEYAGSNIDHYFFDENVDDEDSREDIAKNIKALALSNNIFLLADSDDAQVGSAKHARLAKLMKAESDTFTPRILDKYREIENLFPKEVWSRILIQFCNKDVTEKLGQTHVEDKINEVLKRVNMTAFRKKYIGHFLNEIREKLGREGHQFILNRSEYHHSKGSQFGTLKNKRWLSEILLHQELSWEIYQKNVDLKELTEEIYRFVTEK